MQWLWVEVIVHTAVGLLVVIARKLSNRDFNIVLGYIGWLFFFPATMVYFSMLSFYLPDRGIDVWQGSNATFFWFGFVGMVLSPIAIIGIKILKKACWQKSNKIEIPSQQGGPADAGTIGPRR